MTLGEQITQLRRERKMSQEDLAEALQVSRQSVSKWENGLSNPDTENLIRLAEIFQVDVNLLIGSQLQPEESPVESTPSAPPDQRKTVRLLCVLLALAILSTLIFGAMWGMERAGISLQGIFSPGQKEEMWWDTVQMQAGLLGEEIELTSDEKKAIVEYIFSFNFVEKTETSNENGNYNVGGRTYVVEYKRAGVCFHWYFTERQTRYTVTLPDGSEMKYQYQVDFTLLYKLDEYVFR